MMISSVRTHAQRIGFMLIFCAVPFLAVHAQAQVPNTLPMSHGLHAAPTAGPSAQKPEIRGTVRVLAVMVEFLEDDDTRTSGNGKFGSIYPVDYGAEILDPFPHDRAYFQAHLEFLKNYVRKASGGITTIEADIMENIVTVPGKIQDYSTVRSETNKPLADFTVAAWTEAETAHPGFDFSAYDMFIVFHAGRGQDVDLTSIQGSNPTPFDLPSLSFTLDAYKLLYGDAFEGIPVNGGAFHIANTSVLPTTNNREISLITGERALYELTINGLLAASFGTYAGLPDLFDTETGRTGIGRFGLMDAESIFAYSGICPPAPSAWEKVRLGWAVPREAVAGTNNYTLTAQRSDQITIPDILRVSITGDEYWLVENRHRDPAGNGQTITMMNSGQVSTRTFPKDTTSFRNEDVTALSGVITDVEDLDWSLPGGTVVVDDQQIRNVNGGILVWHIDENIIEANLATNTVNADPRMRGVDLEQAGGAQDIGEVIESIFGDRVAAGSPLDYWFRGNIAPLYDNVFGAATYPNTRSNSGAFSHITMRDFSTRGPLMTVTVSLGDDVIAPREGFPVDLRGNFQSARPVFRIQTADMNGDGEHELLAAGSGREQGNTDTAFVFGMDLERNSLLPNSYNMRLIAEPGIYRWSGAPLIGDITGDGISDVGVYGLVPGSRRFSVYSATDADNNGLYDLLYSFELPGDEDARIVPAIHSGKLFVLGGAGNGPDTLYICGETVERRAVPQSAAPEAPYKNSAIGAFAGESSLLLATGGGYGIYDIAAGGFEDGSGALLPTLGAGSAAGNIFNCAVTDLDGDDRSEAALLTRDGLTLVSQAGDTRTLGRNQMPATLNINNNPAHIAAADVDGDARNDIILSDGDRLLVYNYALAGVDYYPSTYGASYTLSARLTGSGEDALFAVGDRQLSQILTNASQAEGFPVPLPEDASVVLFPAGSGTQHLAIAAAGSDGKLFVFETQNEVDENSFVWRSIYGNERNANFAKGKGSASAPLETFFPQERCYNWPNPAYDDITKFRFYVSVDAQVTIKIYDLAGDGVDQLHYQAVGGTDNEIDWNVSNIESGVYLAHVKAEGGGQSGYKIIKVAIVK